MPPRGGARFPGKVSSCGEARRGEDTPPYGAGELCAVIVGAGVPDAPRGTVGEWGGQGQAPKAPPGSDKPCLLKLFQKNPKKF